MATFRLFRRESVPDCRLPQADQQDSAEEVERQKVFAAESVRAFLCIGIDQAND
jgi:hypothetical protein